MEGRVVSNAATKHEYHGASLYQIPQILFSQHYTSTGTMGGIRGGLAASALNSRLVADHAILMFYCYFRFVLRLLVEVSK